jgi:hypothetical protein
MAKQVLGDYELPEAGDIIDIVAKNHQTLKDKEKQEKLFIPLMKLEKAIVEKNGKDEEKDTRPEPEPNKEKKVDEPGLPGDDAQLRT